MSNASRKYKKECCRTLLGFLRCLIGQTTQIDLYDGVMLVGKLIEIDIYVRIPDEIDVVETIRQDLEQMNPKPKDIVGGGQKKRQPKPRDDEMNFSPLRSANFHDVL